MKLQQATLAAFASTALWASLAGAVPPGHWMPTGGPIGGLGYDVRIHPTSKQTMFVTDNNAGVIRSSNGGKSWSASNTGITVRSGPSGDAFTIFSLTIDPLNPSIVWAGTNGDNRAFGIFKSMDGGATWSLKSSGITDNGYGIVFRGFTVQPGNSDIVYAQAELPTASHGREFNKVQGRVYKTVDGGNTWTLLWSGDNLARYLIVDPASPSTLYLSTGIFDREAFNSNCQAGVPGAGGVGVLKSTNSGATWVPINNGLTDLYVGSLRMHPTNSQILLAATGNNACSGQGSGPVVSGLFRTSNGGASWASVVSDDIMTTAVFSPSSPNIAYAGSAGAFFRSTNAGVTWTRYSQPSNQEWGPPGVRAGVPIDVTVDPDEPNLLYANNYGGGVFRSTDGAQTWEVWSQGYSGADVHAIAASETSPSQVFAVGRSGPFKSSNFGLSWVGIGNGAATFPEWYSVALKPGNAQVVLLSDEHQGVILRSTNAGANFVQVFRHPDADASQPLRRQGFKALAFAPSNPMVVYAGAAKDRGTIDSSAPFGNVIYKSVDGGASFFLPATLTGVNVYRLLVDRLSADTVWAATSGGIFKSTDGAMTWTQLAALGPKVVMALAVDPTAPTTLVASEKNVGIWMSTDGGATWPGGPHNTGFSNPNPAISALVFDPVNPQLLYAGDFYSGVYRSSDGGRTWAGFPDAAMSGLAVRAVKDLAVAGEVLYASTQGGGVFRMGGPSVIPIPEQVTFSPTPVGSSSGAATVTLHNTQDTARLISAKTLTGAQATDFAIWRDQCTSSIAAKGSCTFDVELSPAAPGPRMAVLSIATDDPFASSCSVALSGVGVAAAPDGGVPDAGGPDSGVLDAGATDAGATDAGATDAGVTDAGATDAGATDAGATDAGVTDAGATDAGVTDAGMTDAGMLDGGAHDAGGLDAGAKDAGVPQVDGGQSGTRPVGCGCNAEGGAAQLLLLTALALGRRRGRRGSRSC